MSDKYNGYTNYETWVVLLHLENTPSLQKVWQAAAREATLGPRGVLALSATWPISRFGCSIRAMQDKDRVRQDASSLLASMLKESMADERYPDVTGLYADLLNAALSKVNWMEIAQNYITNDAATEESQCE